MSINAISNEWNLSEILLASHLEEAERNELLSEILHILTLRIEQQADQAVYWISFNNGVRVIRYLGLEEKLRELINSRELDSPSYDQTLQTRRGKLVFTLRGDVKVESIVNWVGCSSSVVFEKYVAKAGIVKRNEYGCVKQGGKFFSLGDAKKILVHYKLPEKPLETIGDSLRGRLLQTLIN